jgi:hypothetical protein
MSRLINIDQNIDIDLYDFYDALDKFDKHTIAELLIDDSIIDYTKKEEGLQGGSISQSNFNEALDKLKTNYYALSTDTEQAILEFAKKY